jgi:uncharacterized protein
MKQGDSRNMGRPKYTITATDVFEAQDYLRDRLLTFNIKLDEQVSIRTAQREFEAAIDAKSKVERASSLNSWCEKFLNTSEWTKLKTCIRKRRERRSRIGEQRTVSISDKAFKLLKKIAKRDNVTYTETLEKHLGRIWRSM